MKEKIIAFNGIDLVLSKFIALSDVKTYRTGSLACDWEYGFDIYTDGGVIPCLFKPENDEMKGTYRDRVFIRRGKLLSYIKDDNWVLIDPIK